LWIKIDCYEKMYNMYMELSCHFVISIKQISESYTKQCVTLHFNFSCINSLRFLKKET
jgi:hypothetical protein